MSLQTSEYDIHHHQITAYLTGLPSQGGLGWLTGNSAQIEPETLLIKSDLLSFMEHGNQANGQSWKALYLDCGRDHDVLWKEVTKAFRAASSAATTHVQILRDGLQVRGHSFSLWNRPEGRSTMYSARHDFAKNCFRMTNEVTVRAEFKFSPPVRRRPDQVFHVNGVYYALGEIKAKQKGQGAGVHGRAKIVGDYREFAAGALREARAAWGEIYQGSRPWPGYAKLSEANQRKIRAWNPAYEKAAWVIALDLSGVWLLPRFDPWLEAVDEVLEAGGDPMFDDRLRDSMLADFTKMPPIADMAASDQVKAHLAGLLDPIRGVAIEVGMFHYPRTDKVSQQKDFLRPRTPQRVFMERFTHRTRELYSQEFKSTWIEDDLRSKIKHALPELDEARTEKIISERMQYRNGREAYSILCQGAAGLGKTNLAVWMALHLYDQLEPLLPGQSPDIQPGPLFDRVVILTDRTELRDNIAQEAERTSGTSQQILLADTKDLLKAALTGSPPPSFVKSGGGIIVVNLQKFPGFLEELAKSGASVKNQVGRTAFIIDEVHRSQSGKLNEQATSLFVDSLGDLARTTNGGKKNLIVGLTATPSDIILARFGEWHAPVSMSDHTRWKPYFAYALRQAIDDGFVLDPTLQVVRYNAIVNWDSDKTAIKASGKTNFTISHSTEKIYENEERLALVAEKFCKAFAEITMLAIPHGFRGFKVGAGKALATSSSIKAAIGLFEAIKSRLIFMADNAKGTPWERYANVVREVAEKRVFILYSDSMIQGEGRQKSCASMNGGLSEKEVIKAFRCVGAGVDNESKNAIIIVVDKLLTGFDEPTLHTLLLDRSLADIGLLQTVCRVNRKIKGKTDTLIIDTCHTDAVIKEIPRVFHKYGGLALSELDGIELVDRLASKRLEILKTPTSTKVWNAWRSTKVGDRAGKERLTNKVNNLLDALIKTSQGEAQELRKTIGGYLAGQRVARSIIALDPHHTNQEGWIDCLKEMHNFLRCGIEDDRNILEIEFEVEGIELDDLSQYAREGVEEKKARRAEGPRNFVDILMDDEDALGGVGFFDSLDTKVSSLQELEEEKRARSEVIRKFLNDLYDKVDAQSLLDNHDSFRKALRNNAIFELDHSARLEWFMKLLNRGTDVRFKNTGTNRRMLGLLHRWRELMFQEYWKRTVDEA